MSHNLFIGENTKIGKNCKISKSVIGNNCQIKDNCELSNCIVRDGCTIGENSKYQFCFLENVQSSVKFHQFKDLVMDAPVTLIDQDIFLETPDNE